MERVEQMNDKNSVEVDMKTFDDSSVLGGMKNTKTCLQAPGQPLGAMEHQKKWETGKLTFKANGERLEDMNGSISVG